MSDQERGMIPARGFGDCHWCGAQMTRLQYLMCPECIRVAEQIPSKTQIVLRSGDFAKNVEGKSSVENVIPELQSFLFDSKQDFPRDASGREHLAKMVEHSLSLVSSGDVAKREEQLKEEGVQDIPSQEELGRTLGIERILRFMLHVAVQQGALKLDDAGEATKFCVVCGDSTSEEIRMICFRCMDEMSVDSPDMEMDDESKDESNGYKGMATSDIVLPRRRR